MKKKTGIIMALLLVAALAVPLTTAAPVLGATVPVSQLITTWGNGTFHVPTGVTSITVECWGAGGAGGGGTTGSVKAGGGGGGAYANKTFSVTPLSDIPYYVAPATSGTTGDGAAGAATWFKANDASGVVAVGGSGGTTAGVGGAGGSAGSCYGDTVYRGGNGANYVDGSGGGGGGGAGSAGPGNDAYQDAGGASKDEYGGAGGAGCHDTGNTAGTAGSVYGGGSGGVKGNVAAAAGAQGLIRITYLAAGYWELTMQVSPPGGGTTFPSIGTHAYHESTLVNITASANPGYNFVDWTAVPGVAFADANNPATNFTMPSHDVTVTANFVAAVGTYNVTMQVSPPGGGTTNPSIGTHAYYPDDVVNIQASVVTGYSFANWTASPAVTFGNMYAAATYFTMPSHNVTVTAHFVVAPVAPVGGTAYPVNKLIILLPWIALGAAVIAGTVILERRRRRAHS
jgi:hypothetical protein